MPLRKPGVIVPLVRDTILPSLFCVAMISGFILALEGKYWPVRSDFTMFYASAQLVRESPTHLYDPQWQAESQAKATGLDIRLDTPNFTPFGYPPITAVLYVPFTWFKHRTAYFLMVFVNAIILAVILWLLSTRFKLRPYAALSLVLCATALLPTYVALLQGQVSFVVLLFFALMITNLADGRPQRAGVWAGLIVVKPTLLLVSLFWLAARKQWRSLAYALTVCLILALGSIALIGTAGIPAYREISERSLHGDFPIFREVQMTGMQNLRAVFAFLGFGTVVWLAAIGMVLAALALIRKQDHGRSPDLCALILATILVTPHIFVQDLDLLLIVVALTLHEREDTNLPALRWLLLAAMLPPFVYYTGMTSWPIVPIVLAGIFCFFVTGSLKLTPQLAIDAPLGEKET